MRRPATCVAVLLGIIGGMAVSGAWADVFFSEDFDGFANDAAVRDAGWAMLNVNNPIEVKTLWTITNPGSRFNPPTFDGTPTTGKFLISDSDSQFSSNLVDSGMSHDLHTPSFSTYSDSTVWLHMDVSAQLNNNGAAVFDIDVSTDGGTSWTNVFRRVSPGRVTENGAVTFPPTPGKDGNADGYYGRLHLDLSSLAASQSDVKLRLRHFEPNWDYWIAIDNVLVDNVAPPGPGSTEVFSEDFSSYTLGQMTVDGLLGAQGGRTWTTTDAGLTYHPGDPGQVDGNYVNRIGHPEPLQDSAVPFAIIDSNGSDYTVDDYLMTPVLDLSDLSTVMLGYQSEGCVPIKVDNDAMRVLLMQDDDDNGPDADDEIVKVVFDYGAALYDTNEEPFYADRLLEVPEAAGRDDVFFAWHFAGNDGWYWAIDNIKVTGTPIFVPPPGDANKDGEVDAEDASLLAANWLKTGGALWEEGDFNGDGNVDDLDASILAANWSSGAGSAAVPEPSTLALLAGGMVLVLLARRRGL